jgi:response regulator RpfG family c-di-GMP phosphodiesterase
MGGVEASDVHAKASSELADLQMQHMRKRKQPGANHHLLQQRHQQQLLSLRQVQQQQQLQLRQQQQATNVACSTALQQADDLLGLTNDELVDLVAAVSGNRSTEGEDGVIKIDQLAKALRNRTSKRSRISVQHRRSERQRLTSIPVHSAQ